MAAKLTTVAFQHFQRKAYRDALNYFALAQAKRGETPEIRVGILLCNLALDMEAEAQALFEFYGVAKEVDRDNAEQLVEGLIESVESGMNPSGDLLTLSEEGALEYEEGISYQDFKFLLEQGSSFPEVFQKVIFSTKVVISDKADFFDFVENLIENGYVDMALGYIDSANKVFPSDTKIRDLLDKISRLQDVETPGH